MKDFVFMLITVEGVCGLNNKMNNEDLKTEVLETYQL